MALAINSRKRTRSENEFEYGVQSKQFVNERTVDMNSQAKMKEIHGKNNGHAPINAFNPQSQHEHRSLFFFSI